MKYILQGFEIQTPDGNLSDASLVTLNADNEKEAKKRAKLYVKKKYFRVFEVYEAEKSNIDLLASIKKLENRLNEFEKLYKKKKDIND